MDFVAVNSNKLQILGLEGKISWVFNVFKLLNLEIFNSKNVKNRKCVHIWANKTCYTNDDEVKRGKGLNWVPSLQEAFSSLHVLSILFFCMNFIVIMLYFIHILHLAFFKFFIIVVLFFFYFELYFSLTLLSLLPYLSSTSHFIFFKLHHHQYLFFFFFSISFFQVSSSLATCFFILILCFALSFYDFLSWSFAFLFSSFIFYIHFLFLKFLSLLLVVNCAIILFYFITFPSFTTHRHPFVTWNKISFFVFLFVSMDGTCELGCCLWWGACCSSNCWPCVECANFFSFYGFEFSLKPNYD